VHRTLSTTLANQNVTSGDILIPSAQVHQPVKKKKVHPICKKGKSSLNLQNEKNFTQTYNKKQIKTVCISSMHMSGCNLLLKNSNVINKAAKG
jgi:hypothetical protein